MLVFLTKCFSPNVHRGSLPSSLSSLKEGEGELQAEAGSANFLINPFISLKASWGRHPQVMPQKFYLLVEVVRIMGQYQETGCCVSVSRPLLCFQAGGPNVKSNVWLPGFPGSFPGFLCSSSSTVLLLHLYDQPCSSPTSAPRPPIHLLPLLLTLSYSFHSFTPLWDKSQK